MEAGGCRNFRGEVEGNVNSNKCCGAQVQNPVRETSENPIRLCGLGSKMAVVEAYFFPILW